MNSEQGNLVHHLADLRQISSVDRTRLHECVFDFLSSILIVSKLDIGKKIIRKHINNNPEDFAFLLAYLSELSEYAHSSEAGHLGANTLPVTLALAKESKFKDADFTMATLVGYEAPSYFAQGIDYLKEKWGANSTGFCGTIGTSMVAAHVHGLSKEDTNSALGIATYLTPFSTQEGYTSGAHGFESGLAASIGIKSIQLARDLASVNIEGPTNILDAYYSRLNGIEPPTCFQTIKTTELGIHELYFKPYPTCRATHPTIQAIEEMLLEKELNLNDVEKIQILTTPGAVNIVGNLPPESNISYIHRQFSMRYIAAATFHGVKILDAVFSATEEDDQKWMQFAKNKIFVALNEEDLEEEERFGTIVQVFLKDGTVRESKVLNPWGSVTNPMKLIDIQYKFNEASINTIGSDNEVWTKDILEFNWPSLAHNVYDYLSSI